MSRAIGVVVLLLALPSAGAGTIIRITGQVIYPAGKPVAGVRVAENWFADQTVPLEPNRPTVTDSDGRFSLELELFNRDTVVMAVDAKAERGGLAVISAKEGQRGPIRVGSLAG